MAKNQAKKKEDTGPSTPDELLESLKGRYENCIVTGFGTDGNIFIASSVGNLPFMHWTLNRSIFELGLLEKQSNNKSPAEDEKAPGSDVDTEAPKS